ncbi:MAG: SAM-dependent methyltransferase, partial [Proteobacteria bacterium]|nr:SAM-dependent methyltransferase [Pseudomonadota bacterium]
MSSSVASMRQQREPWGTIALAESGLLPDSLVRAGIRRLCAERLREEWRGGAERVGQRQVALLDSLRNSALALHTDLANAQHYELPPEFFQ